MTDVHASPYNNHYVTCLEIHVVVEYCTILQLRINMKPQSKYFLMAMWLTHMTFSAYRSLRSTCPLQVWFPTAHIPWLTSKL